MPMLPDEFADLEPFAADWALPTEPERQAKRLASPMPDIEAFYDAAFPRLPDALDWLDQHTFDDLTPEGTNLLHLVYALLTVSFAVECWHQPKIPDVGSVQLHLVSGPTP